MIRGHDVDAAALNKSTNPGSQSKQQIGRVARAREAVDNMLKRWLVPGFACACAFSQNIGLERYRTLTCANALFRTPSVGGPVFDKFDLERV